MTDKEASEKIRENLKAQFGFMPEDAIEEMTIFFFNMNKNREEEKQRLVEFKKKANKSYGTVFSITHSNDDDHNDLAIIEFNFDSNGGKRIQSKTTYCMHVISKATWEYLIDLRKGNEKLLVYYDKSNCENHVVEYENDGKLYEDPYAVAVARERKAVKDYVLKKWQIIPNDSDIHVDHYSKTAFLISPHDTSRALVVLMGDFFGFGYSEAIQFIKGALSPENKKCLIDIENVTNYLEYGYLKLAKELSEVHLMFVGKPYPIEISEDEIRSKYAELGEKHGERMKKYVDNVVEQIYEDNKFVKEGKAEYLAEKSKWNFILK